MKIKKELLIPSIATVLVYLLSYQIPKLVVDINRAHYPSIELDYKIPFIPIFIIIYILAFFQWLNAALVITTQDKKFAYRYLSAIMIGSLIGLTIYIVYPTAINNRPTIYSTNPLLSFIDFIYTVDTPINALPSFHCFCSTISYFIIKDAKLDKKYQITNLIFSIMVFLSTLFTKQHFILDVFSGILLALLSVCISKEYQFNKLFDYLNKKLIA